MKDERGKGKDERGKMKEERGKGMVIELCYVIRTSCGFSFRKALKSCWSFDEKLLYSMQAILS